MSVSSGQDDSSVERLLTSDFFALTPLFGLWGTYVRDSDQKNR